MKWITRPAARALALCALLVTPASTTALGAATAVAKRHHFKLTGAVDTVSTTGTIGTPGTRDTDAGILDGSVSSGPRWSGALRQVVTWGSGLRITSKGTAYDLHGTLRFRLTGRFATRSGGGLTLTGNLTVSGGSGIYEGARGKLRLKGTSPIGSDADAAKFRLTGTLRY